jgi:hypothetical protein
MVIIDGNYIYMGKKLNSIEYINRATEIHKGRYDYYRVEYSSMHDMIEIICPEHGSFLQKAYSHLQGIGCPKCGHRKATHSVYTWKNFMEEARVIHGDKYDYSIIQDIINKDRKVQIICPEHGVFWQSPHHHVKLQHGCPVCGIAKSSVSGTLTTEDFITRAKEIHGDKYNYSRTVYTRSKKKVQIICPKHGIFEQLPVCHIDQAQGCPRCTHRTSRWENEIIDFIKEQGLDVQLSTNTCWTSRQEVDIYIPELKVGFECNGMFFHSRKPRRFHADKSHVAYSAGFLLYHIWDNVDIDLNKSIICSKLGIGHKKEFARKLQVVRLSSNEANSFYLVNHIQGKVGKTSSLHWGLRDMYGELICAMSFRTFRKKSLTVELSRFASKRWTTVIGGFSRLLCTFERWNINQENPYKRIVSFACRDICPDPDKTVYAKNEFTRTGKLFIGMRYYDSLANTVHDRQVFMKCNQSKMWDDFDMSLTEKENCKRHRVFPVYNSGVWTFEKALF